jgi:hypothetical protein
LCRVKDYFPTYPVDDHKVSGIGLSMIIDERHDVGYSEDETARRRTLSTPPQPTKPAGKKGKERPELLRRIVLRSSATAPGALDFGEGFLHAFFQVRCPDIDDLGFNITVRAKWPFAGFANGDRVVGIVVGEFENGATTIEALERNRDLITHE